ncbi:hypothetical protein [Pleurochrysis sp. endemic virus 2]|nr:hypothetical protein [Pleurochrysis sp. endemic virus 2]
MGHGGGPSGSLIMPRACSYCDYYGHTKQYCKRLKADRIKFEKNDTDKIIGRHRRWLEQNVAKTADRDPDWTAYMTWCDARYSAARDAGVEECARGFPACEQCAQCKACCAFYTARDAEHPPPAWHERWGERLP